MSAVCMVSGTGEDDPVVSMYVPFPPIPVQSDGVVNIAYELETSGFAEKGLNLTRAEALDPASGIILSSLEDEALLKMYHPASVPPPTPGELQNGTKNLTSPRISFWIRVENGYVPDEITHHLTFKKTPDSITPIIVTGGDVRVKKEVTPVSISAPLRGGGWLALETTGPYTHHFNSQITMNNVTKVPQRYAQDWMKLSSDNIPFVGDYLKNENWTGYGEEILAVADGTIAGILDGVPDNDPVGTSPPIDIPRITGNNVILAIGDGLYACYGHMIPGSITVKTGDIVRRGDVLGRVGNSGNSGSPHLHFQISDGPGFLPYEGMPFTFQSFDTAGTCDENLTCAEYASVKHHRNEIVENNVIVQFPDT